MPVKAASFKALRQSRKHRIRNRRIKDGVKTVVKKAQRAISAKNAEQAKTAIQAAIKTIDKARQKGILKLHTASRKKSRLVRSLNALILEGKTR